MELNLKKPLAFFDIEATGLHIIHDRIVEISILKINPNGTKENATWLVNPEKQISAEAESIHGYNNEQLADKPAFRQVAKEIDRFLQNCDLAGYNAIKFDIPMLVEEFLRADVDFDLSKRRVIDVQNIFMKMEQRTLSAASMFYLQRKLENAHTAEADTLATYEILKAQLDRYENTPFTDKSKNTSVPVKNDMDALHAFSTHHHNADLMGQIIYNEQNEEIINFGKHKGKKLAEVFSREPSYYDWMMKGDFPLYTKKLITKVKLSCKNE